MRARVAAPLVIGVIVASLGATAAYPLYLRSTLVNADDDQHAIAAGMRLARLPGGMRLIEGVVHANPMGLQRLRAAEVLLRAGDPLGREVMEELATSPGIVGEDARELLRLYGESSPEN